MVNQDHLVQSLQMSNGEYDWYDVRDKEGNVLRKLFHKKGDNE